jgi:hypothetical protein
VLEQFNAADFATEDCVAQAQRFSPERFSQEFSSVVEKTLSEGPVRSAVSSHRAPARGARGRGLARQTRLRS